MGEVREKEVGVGHSREATSCLVPLSTASLYINYEDFRYFLCFLAAVRVVCFA